MEDIYDDLRNYEDVHALEELRAENKELKVKLEEHSAAMEKLQKEILQDYDTLQIAFKQLENNYSSLLMTARSELERKTQRITQLSKEKDVMILDAFNSGRNIRRNFNNPGRRIQDRYVKGNDRPKQDHFKQKNVDIKTERRDPHVKPTKDAGPDSGTSNKSSKAAGVKLESFNIRKSNVNDNLTQQKTDVNERPKTSASSIKDRRKSVPAVSMPIDKFSSSDEERNYPAKETKTDNERKNINKLPIERPSNKTSEPFSVDDRSHKYHDSSSGDIYKSRSSKHHDSSSHRGRDKYEFSSKYRKQYSPERYPKQREHLDAYPKQREHLDAYPKQREHLDAYPKQREHLDAYPKQHREYTDDYTKKPRDYPDDYPKSRRDHPDDYTKKHRMHPDNYTEKRWDRPDDSKHRSDHPDDYPKKHREHPDDIHKHERGRYQGRSLESPPSQSYNRRERTKSVHQSDHDRYPHEPEQKINYRDDKYSAKHRSKDDEPPIKRQRTESYGNPETHSADDKRHYRVRDSVDAHTPDFSPPHEYDILRLSCQSPDSVHIEGAIAYPTKEIMATASTPLEDPRVTSKRYVIRKENGKEILSTAVGRNIDIIRIRKAVWDIKRVDVPVALVRRPSQCSDQLVQDIYMDIENPVTNLDASMESGEVCGTDDEFHEIRCKPKEIQHDTQDLKISKQAPEDISKQTVSKPNIAKYHVRKIGPVTKNTQRQMDVPIIELGEMMPQHKNVNKNGAAADTDPKEVLTQKKQNNKQEDFLHSKKKNSKEVVSYTKSKSREGSEHQSTLTKMATVADDLELSDDNSDHMDTGKKNDPEKFPKICGKSLNMSEGRSNESVNNVETKKVSVNNVENKTVSAHKTGTKSIVETTGTKDVAEEEKTKESDSAKKQRAKKKKSKSKEIFKDLAESSADPIHVSEKKPKSKKEKESTPKETKEKFCDLFGDSNSLMTPEDLGIPSYLPISEDAQDAVDMKINQIIDAEPLLDKDKIPGEMLPQNRVEVIVQEIAGHDDTPNADLQKTDMEAKEAIHELKKKKSSKRNEEVIDTNQLPSPIVYENLNPGADLNDLNVVKTVIISTGKQPENGFENKIDTTKPDALVKVNAILNTKDMNISPATMEFKKDILKALATSTPHKEFSALNPLEADNVKTDIICDPCVSKAVATITNLEPNEVSQTEKTTLESNDAPDVRIFVKRRRKVMKRPPMT